MPMPWYMCRCEGGDQMGEILCTSSVGSFYAVCSLEVRDGIEVLGALTGSMKGRNYGYATWHIFYLLNL